MDGYKVHGTEEVWASAGPSSRLTALFVVHSGKYIKMILIIKVALLYFNMFSKWLCETEQGSLSESADVNMIHKWTLIGHCLCEPMNSHRGRAVLALIAMMNYREKVPYTDKRFILAHGFGVRGHDLNDPTALSFW